MTFPWVILRRKNVEQIHERNRELNRANNSLNDENKSLSMVIMQKDTRISALEDKCSRVGISKLENKIVILEQINQAKDRTIDQLNGGLRHETLPDTKLQQSDAPKAPVLQDTLVSTAEGTAAVDTGLSDLFGSDGIQDLPGFAFSGG